VPVVTWDSKLSAAVGGATAKKLQEAFGHTTVGDLLLHYPRAYVRRGETSDLTTLQEGEHTTVIARVVSSSQHPYRDRRTGQTAYRVEVVVEVGGQKLYLTFFDKRKRTADWRVDHLAAGVVGMFEGRAGRDRVKGRWQLVHPHSDILDRAGAPGAAEVIEEERRNLSELRPVYPASKKISSWAIEGSVKLALEVVEEVPEPLPPAVRLQYGLLGTHQALEWIHRPDSFREREAAERTLRFQEAFVTQAELARRRAELLRVPAQPRPGVDGGLLDRFDQRLPFDLTTGQRRVSEEILGDLADGHPMHRLLQGEVGSGKTVVALRAMLRVVDSGGQAALLAPTEVLAQQHYRSITAMLGDLAAGGMLDGAEDGTRVALLTGSMTAASRRSALLDVASGAAGIVVGTHALLEEKVQFADLGLVVVDEQHRFGVEQRAALAAKAGEVPPHVLVMTATPIPRTVAMTVFGDLETSTLAELPAGRAEIQTNVVPVADRPEWLDRVWARVREESEKGHQTYVVCPRIGGEENGKRARATEEEADADPGDDKAPTAAVEEITPGLRDGVLRGLRVEPLHGRMPVEQKEQVMRAFAAGDVDVLVSTTVIEVGVDVANATAMVVLDADRFGVSQLHQLRGRVGRGGLHGLCLLVTRAEKETPARERLDAVAATLDGFELSRIDLRQRREGDVLGVSQSGRRSSLRLLSVLEHEDVIADARDAATALVADDPDLSAHPALAAAVRRLHESEQADFLEKA
jgi:ATP-dependent DNA helicase RecG